MKKHNIITVLICLSTWGVSAQILSLSGDTMTGNDYANSVEIVTNGTITNHTQQNVTIRWNRITNDLPRDWESQVCDPVYCYLPEVDTKTFTLAADSTGTFHVNFSPNNEVGIGVVELEAYIEGSDSAASYVKGVYIADAVTGIQDNGYLDNSAIRIYPNPVKDFILVRNLPQQQASSVEVYNIFGKKLLSFFNPVNAAKSNIQKYDLESLPKGIYMIRVYDSFMNVIHTKSISKVN